MRYPTSGEPDDATVEAFISLHPGGATADEIAEELGVTRQRVFQLLNGAIKKVRQHLTKHRIYRMDDVIV